jgi:molybdopterin-guanine dinucleotide biosynthesis protein A
VETVILAAGRGSRLKNLAPPYFKPLMIVDSEPLIRRLVRTAWEVSGDRVVVVAAPENTLPLCQVLDGLPAEIVVQRAPLGPGDALLTGLGLVTSPEVCVLLGDNVMSTKDQHSVAQAVVPAVGVVLLPPAKAGRYTYLTPDGVWVEKQPPRETGSDDAERLACWVGPLKLETEAIRFAIETFAKETTAPGQEIPIGPLLNQQGPATLVEVSSVDIGVPEMWAAQEVGSDE